MWPSVWAGVVCGLACGLCSKQSLKHLSFFPGITSKHSPVTHAHCYDAHHCVCCCRGGRLEHEEIDRERL